MLVPSLYLMVYDVQRGLHWLWTGSWTLPEEELGETEEDSQAVLGAGGVTDISRR